VSADAGIAASNHPASHVPFFPQVHTLMVGAALATHREDSELVEVATKFLLRLGEPSALE
jgi:hypothetical protein